MIRDQSWIVALSLYVRGVRLGCDSIWDSKWILKYNLMMSWFCRVSLIGWRSNVSDFCTLTVSGILNWISNAVRSCIPVILWWALTRCLSTLSARDLVKLLSSNATRVKLKIKWHISKAWFETKVLPNPLCRYDIWFYLYPCRMWWHPLYYPIVSELCVYQRGNKGRVYAVTRVRTLLTRVARKRRGSVHEC